MDLVGEPAHLVRLYVLFHEPVIANVQDELVEFDEVVEAAIVSYRNAGLPTASASGPERPHNNKEKGTRTIIFLKEIQIDEPAGPDDPD